MEPAQRVVTFELLSTYFFATLGRAPNSLLGDFSRRFVFFFLGGGFVGPFARA